MLTLWHIATGTHPLWSGEGARRFGQRWNPPGLPAIYCGTSFAICLLETLVHANRLTPPSAARYVRATVPDDVSREVLDAAALPGWAGADLAPAQHHGAAWLRAGRTALLIVPNVVTGGLDQNVVVNPLHPDAARIAPGPETAVALDARLFGPRN